MSFIPFYGTQIINHFLSSMISANHDKVKVFKPIAKSLYPFCFSIVKFLNLKFNEFFLLDQNLIKEWVVSFENSKNMF